MMIYWSLVIGIINVLYFCQLIHFFIITTRISHLNEIYSVFPLSFVVTFSADYNGVILAEYNTRRYEEHMEMFITSVAFY